MIFYRIYIVALVFSFFLFAQEQEEDEIIVSKSDLIDIAQSLLESEDYPNAISIYQQILDYNMNTYGVVSDEVAQVSSIIGDLMLKANRFYDAEVYFSQALGIKSQIILMNQLDLQFPLMSLREIYTINNDSTKLEEVNKTLDMIVGADSMRINNEYWDPMTFGLQNIQSDSDDILAGYNYSNYQSMNLINIADSYFDAELYYDAIENLLKAIIIDESNMTIDFLNKYISKHIVHVPSMMNALVNFTHDDELFGGQHLFLLSLIHYQRSENELGSYYIEEYIKSNPSDHRSYQLTGDYHFKNSDFLSALFYYRKSKQLDSSSLYTHYKSALCLYKLNYLNESVEILSDIIDIDSNNRDAYYLRSLSYMNLEHYDNAIKDLTDYILLNPEDEEIYFYLGVCYYNIKKYNRSKEALNRYLKYNNQNAEAHYYLGIINENILELDLAVNHYTLARKLNPQLHDSNLRLGLLHYNNQKFNQSVEPLRDYLIYHPNNVEILKIFAEVLVLESRYLESIDAYYKLYETDPTNYSYLHIIADSYIEVGRIEDAKNLLTKLILLGELNQDILFNLATIEVELGEFEQAITHYLMAMEIGAPSIELHYNLAMSYAQIGNYMQALLAFQNAYKMNVNDNDVIFQISMCYKELEVYSESIKYLNLFINNTAEDYLTLYLMGELYFLIEDYKNSEFYLKKALAINSQDSMCLYYLGMCSFSMDDFVNAAKYFKRSIKINPDYAGTHFNLALVYHALGKNREVKKQLNIIYMLDQDLHDELSLIIEKK